MNSSEYRLVCDDYVEDGNKIYFSSFSENAVFEADKETHRARLLFRFPFEKKNNTRLYLKTIKLDDRIIFAPCIGKTIAIYNLKTHSLTQIILREPQENGNITSLFRDIIYTEDALFFVGHKYPAIVEIRLSDYSVKYISDWVPELMTRIRDNTWEGRFLMPGINVNDKVVFPVYGCDSLLQFDSRSRETRIIDIKSDLKGFYGIEADGKHYWVTSRRMDYILKLDQDFNILNKIAVPDFDPELSCPFYKPFVMKNGIYIVPVFSRYGYVIDPNTDEISRCEKLCNMDEVQKSLFSKCWDLIMCPKKIDNERLLYITGNDMRWHIYNTVTGFDETFFVIPEDPYGIQTLTKKPLQSFFSEEQIDDLESWLMKIQTR